MENKQYKYFYFGINYIKLLDNVKKYKKLAHRT